MVREGKMGRRGGRGGWGGWGGWGREGIVFVAGGYNHMSILRYSLLIGIFQLVFYRSIYYLFDFIHFSLLILFVD